jgi:hypothetical protein
MVAKKSPKSTSTQTSTQGQVQTLVEIPPVNIRTIELTLVGDSGLITHCWSEKAKKEMLAKQMKLPAQKKEPKDPVRDFLESMYWLTPMPKFTETRKAQVEDANDAKFGFPAIAFKAAAVDACSQIDGVTKVFARGAFHVPAGLVEILSDNPPTMREDMVRVGMGTADLRYRGEFMPWRVKLLVRFNASAITAEQIVNLFQMAGLSTGVGEWRPTRDGENGLFHVSKQGE